MNIKRVSRSIIIIVIFISGVWLLFQQSRLTPETVERQGAVQRALRPGGLASSGGQRSNVDLVAENSPVIAGDIGEPVAPVAVDMMAVSQELPESGGMEEAWEAGLIDIGRIDSPYSSAAMDTLLAESAAQAVDPSVQILAAPGENEPNKPAALVKNSEFKSIDFNQTTGSTPPDPMLTVGHKGIIAAVNTSFQIVDFLGNTLAGPTTFASFWGAACGTGSGVVFFDPFVEYDEKERRYILGITAYDPTVNSGDNGYACIAVSQTDNPVGDYWLYSFNGNLAADPALFFDYPHLGVGQEALYFSGNMFSGDTFVRSHMLAVDKSTMYAGASATWSLVKINNQFTIQPAKIHGLSGGGWPTNINEPHYYVSANTGNNQDTLTVWKFTDPFGSPSVTQAGLVTVNTYNMPLNQPQLGSGNEVQANDNRMLDVKYWQGRLYATHTIGCNPGGGTVNCVRWYIIDISTGTPVLLQQGSVGSGAGDFGRFFPAIATNACGDVLLGYSGSGPNHYPGAYVIGREAADPAGQVKSELAHKSGEVTYTAFDTPPYRWGDYTGMAIDPDGKTFWYLGQYSRNQSNTRWSTWIGQYEWAGCTGLPPTPTPTATATSTATATATIPPGSTPTSTSTSTPTATATSTATPESEYKYKLHMPVVKSK